MSRIYNFSAGPSMLPLEVLEQAAAEMTDYNGSGMSVMEMSHRSPVYDAIIKQTEADFRTLMNIPDNYKVLFLQGGASTQFAAVPLNLMTTGNVQDLRMLTTLSNTAVFSPCLAFPKSIPSHFPLPFTSSTHLTL